jgi:DNA-directed RNA polymerase subunit RPC12/RpoP
MALKILVAGIDKDARARVEAAVKQALGARAASEDWTVSLVKVAGQWSVTLNGPGERFRNLSFGTDEGRLSTAISEVVEGGGEMPRAAGSSGFASTVPRSESGDRHVCADCQREFVVVYESQPNEAKVLAAVACPHCWKVSHVEVGAWAAAGRDYRAEKA